MFLGIEIGGTKLQLGLGRGDGVLAGLWRGGVDVARGADGIREQIVHAVPQLLAQAGIDRGQLRGVGIGFGGPVDDATHTVIKSHQIDGWDDFPLADWISNLVGLPAALGNDADVAGLAEALFGAGKGFSPIFYITIGSGIGGGLIINGEIYRGRGRGAAEIGHLRVPFNNLLAVTGPPDPLEIDALENVSSGWAIERLMRHIAENSPGDYFALYSACGGEPSTLTMRHVAEALQYPLERLDMVFAVPLKALSEAICHVIALLCPSRIILGGGVALMGDQLLFEPLRKLVAERVFKPFADCYEIIPAALGEEVVVHGALALARKRLGA
jgi:glucokinase